MQNSDRPSYEFRVYVEEPMDDSGSLKWMFSWYSPSQKDMVRDAVEIPWDVRVEDIEYRTSTWAAALERYYAGLSAPEQVAFFEEFLSSDRVNVTQAVSEQVDDGSKDYLNRKLLIYTIFYGGIFKFLHRYQKYEEIDAHLLYLFSIWQWYNLVKRLLKAVYEGEIDERVERYIVVRQMAQAHQQISRVLDDETFAQAFYWLKRNGKFIGEPSPLFRERVFMSLPLDYKKVWGEFAPQKTLPAPGLKEDLNWSDVKIHPVFEDNPGGRTAVRNLIVNRLLSRYDYGNAIRLTYLLANSSSYSGYRKFVHMSISSLIWVIVNSIIVSICLVGFGKVGTIFQWLGLSLIWVGPIGFGFIAWKKMERQILPHLILPRLIGGITLANLTIILEGGIDELINPLWSYSGAFVILLNIIVIGVSFGYLFMDVRPLVRDRKTARKRSFLVLSIASILSLIWGLITSSLLTRMSLDGGNIAGIAKSTFFSLFGWVDYKLYLVIFPVTLLTGLVTQFLFEEKTVTSPVWSIEEE